MPVIWRESVLIDKPAKEVWEYIENPEHMPAWNPKVKKVSPISWSTDRNVGFRYGITYAMSGKASDLDGEFTEYHPPSRIVIRLRGGRLPLQAYIEEIYDLSEKNGATLLTQTIVTHEVHINIF